MTIQPPHPHDPTTSPRSWTDAFPVADRDADALDAWLDTRGASPRAGDAPSPADDHHPIGQNGQTAAAGEDATFPLTAAARHIHACLETAQRIGVPDVPEDAIWEKIMSSHLALDHVPATRPASTCKRRQATTATTASPRPVRKIAGSHPSISIVLFAALLIAIVAGFRGMNGSGPQPSPTSEDTLAIAANASPAARTSNRCVVRTLTDGEGKQLMAERLAAAAPQYLPTKGPAPETESKAAITTFGDLLVCGHVSDAGADFKTYSPQTDRFWAESHLLYTPDTRKVLLEQRLRVSRELSPVLVVQDPSRYIVDTNDPVIRPYLLEDPANGQQAVLLPQDFVVLADGRIGAPLKVARPGGANPGSMDNYLSPQSVSFVFFTDDNGRWVFDEFANLCTAHCDRYFANKQAEIDQAGKQPTLDPRLLPKGSGTATAAVTPVQRMASPSPVAARSAGANPCVVRTLTDEEVAKLREARLAAPEPAFLPTTGTAPQLAASAAIATFDDSLACTVNAEQSRGTSSFSPWTDNFFAEYNLRYPTDSRIVIQEQTLAASRQLSPVLVDMDPTHYIVDSNDPAVQPFIHRQESSGGQFVLFPQDFVVMADGRIGVPVKLAFPGGNQTFTKDDYRTPQSVQFAIFANVDGTWLLDQSIDLCTWKCDQFYADLQIQIDQDHKWLADLAGTATPAPSTPVAGIQATPNGVGTAAASAEATASPVAADPWLQPITAAECATPTTTGRPEAEMIAVTSRWYLACGNERNNVQDVISFFSADLLARHPELLKGQYTLQAADIDSSKAVSSALASKNIQLLEQGVPGADDDTTRTSGFYEVFLPQNAVVLPDGRIAIPFTIAFPDPANFTRAKTSQAADPKAPQAAGALVFVKDGDTWKIDEFGAICIANCDGVWNEQKTHVGTPSPSNDELATASAEAAKRLPIPPESCMVPTATASASDLPNRSYNRLMMPTTNKADGAAAAASNVITCLNAAPVATPVAILELLPPLITKRLQQELLANGDDPQLTMAQINGARDVSTYLEEQTTYKPFERAAEGVHDAPPDVWPANLQGDSFDPTPGWYNIILPENSIQFPDGRVGVPITYMITSDALWNDLGSRSSSGETSIYVFAPTEGAWKLDEVLPLCLGDCDAYWTEQEANIGTPAVTASPSSLPHGTPAASPVASPAGSNADRRTIWI